ncbi:MAG: hypothetical protein B7Y93_00260 [Micrococcales bacterium 32-70-13]|nr:MAG: hypothetical protein B7Y93_00260 [Micrococcales bacterium 32-70-13]
MNVPGPGQRTGQAQLPEGLTIVSHASVPSMNTCSSASRSPPPRAVTERVGEGPERGEVTVGAVGAVRSIVTAAAAE